MFSWFSGNKKPESQNTNAPPQQQQQQSMSYQQPQMQYQQQQQYNPYSNNNNNNNNAYAQQLPQPTYPQQQYSPYNNNNNNNNNYMSSLNAQKRAKKKKTGRKLRTNEAAYIPQSKMTNNVELDTNINEEQFLSSVQQAYGPSARVEIQSRNLNYKNNANRQQISYQVVFDNQKQAQAAYKNDAVYQQQVAANLGIKGNALAFDKPAEPKSIDGITLQLDSDTSSILCGACLIYDSNDKCIKVVHYSDRNYNNVIKHSGDTQVHGKSVHTIKLLLSDLDKNVKQLFFTLCACGQSDLSGFKEPVISLYENNEEDINLIQYGIEQAAKARSVVMCRLFRAGKENNDWSIQALGSEEWHIQQKVCMAYHNAQGVINAHLKVMKENKEKNKEVMTSEGG
eukprot:944555_1